MIHKLALLSVLVLSVSCMVLHQVPIPITLGLQHHDSPNYNFAYEVNDAHTGDIKNQRESRRGDTVLGQYSLLQPDGVRRVVDYRADQHDGFRATVSNDGAPSQNDQVNNVEPPKQAPETPSAYSWPAPSTQTPPPPPPVAMSRSSIVQTFSSPIQTPTYGQYGTQNGNVYPWL